MQLSLSTPALLFPAISLLLLAYTNRFLAIATLVRNLHSQYKNNKDQKIISQIKNFRLRIRLIRDMQALGVLSLLLCVFSMFLFYEGMKQLAEWVFGFALILLMISLILSTWEIYISTNALKVQLSDISPGENNL